MVVACSHGGAAEIASALWLHSAAARPPPAGADEPDLSVARLLSTGVLLLGSVLLVAPGDVRGLARAIDCALAMPADERERRTAAARAAARAAFSLDAFVEGTLAVYQGCAHERMACVRVGEGREGHKR